MPGDIGRQQAAGQLHQRVALLDRGFARRALATQGQPADHRDVLPGLDLVAAMGAARVRQDQVEGIALGLRRKLQRLPRLRLPVTEHHHRQAVDDDVEKAADEKAEEEYAENKGRQIAGQEVDDCHLSHYRTEREDRQVHRDDQAADQYAEHGHDHGLHQGGQVVDRVVDFFFIERGDLVQHAV